MTQPIVWDPPPQMVKDINIYNEEILKNITENLHQLYLLTSSIFLSLIQVGFTCLIVGSVHSKNTADIMLKNFLGIFICGLAYYCTGHAFAFGDGSSVIGLNHWFNLGLNNFDLAAWYYNFTYASIVSAITSSSMAERCTFPAYLIINAFISGISYPICSHWVWHRDGFLKTQGYIDGSGCGPIHIFSGTAAFIAARVIGPRKGRFQNFTVFHYPSHSRTLIGIGFFLRITGELLFAGSLTDEGEIQNYQELSNHIMSDVCGGAGAFMVALVLGWFVFHKGVLPFELLMYSALAGIVSCQAAGHYMRGWEALITGILGSLLFYALHFFLILVHVDDPIDITAVHFGGGVVGLLTAPFFGRKGVARKPGSTSLKVLAANALGLLTFMIWAGATSILIFGVLKGLQILRVPNDVEITGMDKTYHNVIAYPAKAWEWGIPRSDMEDL